MAGEQGGGRRPSAWVVGLAGLALMVGGWKLMTYAPAPAPRTKREVEAERQLESIRGAVEKAEREGSDPSKGRLGEAVRELDRKRHTPVPPYKVQGQLVFWGGLALFIVAGVLMYRHKPAEARPEEEP
jgi:hypothetical protein